MPKDSQVILMPAETTSSVEIKENAKGEPQLTVKAYASSVKKAGAQALAEYRRLRAELESF